MSNSYRKALPSKAGRKFVASTGGETIPKGALVSIVAEANQTITVNKTTASTIHAYVGVVESDLGDGHVKVVREGNALLEGGQNITAGTKIYIDELGLYATNRNLTNLCIGVATGDSLLPKYNVVLNLPVNDIRFNDFAEASAAVASELTGDIDDLTTLANNVDANANSRLLTSDWNVDKTNIDASIDDLRATNTSNVIAIESNSARITELEGNLTGSVAVSLSINNETKIATVAGSTSRVQEGAAVRISFEDDDGNSFSLTDGIVGADGSFDATTTIVSLFYGNIKATATVTDIYSNLLTGNDTETYIDISGGVDITSISVHQGWGTISLEGNLVDHDGASPVNVRLTDRLGTSVDTNVTALTSSYRLDDFLFRNDLAQGTVAVTVSSMDIYGNPIVTGVDVQWNQLVGSLTPSITYKEDVAKDVTVRVDGDLLFPNTTGGNTSITLSLLDKNGTSHPFPRTSVSGTICRAYFDNIHMDAIPYGAVDIIAKATDYYGNEVTETIAMVYTNTGPVAIHALNVSVDNEAGQVSISGDGDYISRNATVSLVFSNASKGTTVNASATYNTLNGSAMDRRSNIAGSFAKTFTFLDSLGDGEITVDYSVTDYFGRLIDGTIPFTYEQPGVITANALINDDTDTITISGSTERVLNNATVEARMYDHDTNTLVKTTNITVSSGSYTKSGIDISGASFGTMRVECTVLDKYGDSRSATAMDEYDDVHSVITFAYLTTDHANSTASLGLKWYNTVAGTAEITLKNGSNEEVFSFTHAVSHTANNHVEIVSLATLPYGSYTATVKMLQPNGDYIESSRGSTFLDWNGNVEVTSVAVNNANDTISVLGDTFNVDEGRVVNVSISDLDGDTVTRTTTVAADGTWGIAGINVGALKYGTLTVVATTTDKTNTSVSDTGSDTYEEPGYFSSISFWIDSTTMEGNVSATTHNFTAGTRVDVTFEDSDGNAVSYWTGSYNDNGTLKFNMESEPIDALDYGSITATISAVDIHGASRTVTRVATFSDVNGKLFINGAINDTTKTWNVVGVATKVAAGSTVTLTVTNSAGTVTRTYTATTTVGGEYTRSFSVSNFDYGVLTIVAKVTDLGGTERTSSLSDELVALSGDISITSWSLDEFERFLTVSGTSSNIKPGSDISVRIDIAGYYGTHYTTAGSTWTITDIDLYSILDHTVSNGYTEEIDIEAWGDDLANDEITASDTFDWGGYIRLVKSHTASIDSNYTVTTEFDISHLYFHDNSYDYEQLGIRIKDKSGNIISAKWLTFPHSDTANWVGSSSVTIAKSYASGWFKSELLVSPALDDTYIASSRSFYYTQAPAGRILVSSFASNPINDSNYYYIAPSGVSGLTGSTVSITLQYRYTTSSTWYTYGTDTLSHNGSTSYRTGDPTETDGYYNRVATPDAYSALYVRAKVTGTDERGSTITSYSSQVLREAENVLPTGFVSQSSTEVVVQTGADGAQGCSATLYYRWWIAGEISTEPGGARVTPSYFEANDHKDSNYDMTKRTYLGGESTVDSNGRITFDTPNIATLHDNENEQGSGWRYEVVVDGVTLVNPVGEYEEAYWDDTSSS